MQREVPGALVLYPSGEPSGAHAPPGIRTADFVLDKDFFLIEGHPIFVGELEILDVLDGLG